jgi:hypothetical protein
MESMSRATWTDERLDDFACHTDRRFDGVDHRIDELARRVDSGFNRVDADLREVRSEMRTMRTEMDSRFDALQRVLIQAAVTLSVSFLTVGGAIVVTQL